MAITFGRHHPVVTAALTPRVRCFARELVSRLVLDMDEGFSRRFGEQLQEIEDALVLYDLFPIQMRPRGTFAFVLLCLTATLPL